MVSSSSIKFEHTKIIWHVLYNDFYIERFDCMHYYKNTLCMHDKVNNTFWLRNIERLIEQQVVNQ